MDRETETGIKQAASPQAVVPTVVPAAAPAAGAVERREVESAALLAGGRELRIRHGGETYTLRQTSKGKLILTK